MTQREPASDEEPPLDPLDPRSPVTTTEPTQEPPSDQVDVETNRQAAKRESVPATANRLVMAYSNALIFGPPGSLRPQPAKLTPQGDDWRLDVADTALDWLDASTARVRAVSVRGHGHRHDGTVRQDSYSMAQQGDLLTMAVADGLGSCHLSHLGSRLAAVEAVRSEWRVDAASDQTGHTVDIGHITDAIVTQARDRARALSDDPDEPDAADVSRAWSTTLVVAQVALQPHGDADAGYNVLLIQVGDSSAWKLSDGEWTQLVPPGRVVDAESAIDNVVDPLPSCREAVAWHERFRPHETLALMSDGVANILQANSKFAEALAKRWKHAAPTPSALLRIVDATVKTYDDDRTFVGLHFLEPSA